MKLRSIICAFAVAAAMVASATTTVTGANTFARLPVTSSYTNSIIAIPLSGCGEATEQIYVTNLVQTTNLTPGDTLMYKNGENWNAWELDSSYKWQEMTVSQPKGGVTPTPLASGTQLACGKACWLYRSNPNATIYLYGQTNAVRPGVTVAAGTSSAITYTIVGYPNEAVALDLATWHPSGVAAGDLVVVPASGTTGQKTYKSNGSAWTTKTVDPVTPVTEVKNPFTKQTTYVTNFVDTAVSSGTTIPAGCGFMYGRKATSALPLAW